MMEVQVHRQKCYVGGDVYIAVTVVELDAVEDANPPLMYVDVVQVKVAVAVLDFIFLHTLLEKREIVFQKRILVAGDGVQRGPLRPLPYI
jgi:hypothetical protein